MKWEDVGLVLSARKFSERDAILSVLTRNHGIWRAVVKGALSRNNRATYEPGNLLLVRWNARLAEHMGNFSCELLEQNAAALMQSRQFLTVLNAVCALVEGCFEERDPHPALFEEVRKMVEGMIRGQETTPAMSKRCVVHCGAQERGAGALKNYALFEKFLLAEAGYGLDLSCCAATGVRESLIYISPKTGRAVCAAAGAPYHEKMLPLPRLHRDDNFTPQPAEILDALRVSGYFLGLWLYAPMGRNLPLARQRLEEMIEKGVGIQESGIREEEAYAESRILNPESL